MVMKTHPAIENICIVADINRTFIVALIIASRAYLEEIAKTFGTALDYEELINDTNIELHMIKELLHHGTQNGLEPFEIPKHIKLVNDKWTPESGLLSPSFKVKRKEIQKYYQSFIDQMYLSCE